MKINSGLTQFKQKFFDTIQPRKFEVIQKNRLVFIFMFFFIAGLTYGQQHGDYRSNVTTTGNWNVASNWQVYDSTTASWITATYYPGQLATPPTGNVTIQAGDTIFFNTNITNSIASVNIYGVFAVVQGTAYTLNTLHFDIMNGGRAHWPPNKGQLILPANADLSIVPGGLITWANPCSSLATITIGSNNFATCNGGNGKYSFAELNAAGGTLHIEASSNAPICKSDSLRLTAAVSGLDYTTSTYVWTGTGPGGYTYSASGSYTTGINRSLKLTVVGNYIFKLTGTRPSPYNFTHYDTIHVYVDSNSIGGTAASSQSICSGNMPSNILLNGNSHSVYQWQDSTGVSSWTNVSGATSNTLTSIQMGLLNQTHYYRAKIKSYICVDSAYSNIVKITVHSIPQIDSITAKAICANGTFNPTPPTVTSDTGSIIQGWQLETSVGSGVYSNIVVPYVVLQQDNGKRIRYYATNGCGTAYSNVVFLTVLTTNTIVLTSAVGTDSQSVCLNDTIIQINYATQGATGATFTGLPPGVNCVWSSDVITITGIPTTSNINPYKYIITLTGGCGNVVDSGYITVYSLPSFTLTYEDVSCYNQADGIITINPSGGSGTGYEYRIQKNSGTWSSWQVVAPVTNLDVETYNIEIKDSYGCIQTECP